MAFITTREAAARLGLSRRRLTELIDEGRLPAARFGRAWAIEEADLEGFERPKRGRPPAPWRERWRARKAARGTAAG